MNYVIAGYFGYGNGGDDAVLAAMVEALRGEDDEANIAVIVASGGEEAVSLCRRLGVQPVPRMNIAAFATAVRSAHLFISGGGSLLQDGTSFRSLAYYAGQLIAARGLGCPRLVYAQGAGPLRRRSSRRLVGYALAGATVTVRDRTSERLLAACGVEGVQVAADPVFAWGRPGVLAAAFAGAEQRNRLGIVWRSWPGLDDRLADLWPALRGWAAERGLRPVFFPLHRRRDEDVLRRAGIPREAVHPWLDDPRDWPGAFARCRFAVSVRYHGVVFAALAGAPALAVGYDPKMEAVCEQLRLPPPIAPRALDPSELLLRLEEVVQREHLWRQQLPRRLAELAEAARLPARLAVAMAREGARGTAMRAAARGTTSARPSCTESPAGPSEGPTAGRGMPSRPRVDVLGAGIDPVSQEEAQGLILSWVFAAGAPSRCRLVVTGNPELWMRLPDEPGLRDVLSKADLVVADGIGLVWAARHLGRPLPERVAGIDLAEGVLRAGAARGLRVFLCGARPGVAERAAQRLCAWFPGLEIAGVAHGYFAPEEEEAVVASIAASGAQLLLAGLGAPRQELWLYRWRDRLGVRVSVGIGGAFDVWAGDAVRAPRWMQGLGMEWAYRLLRQPSRARRMLSLPRFAWRVLRTGRRR